MFRNMTLMFRNMIDPNVCLDIKHVCLYFKRVKKRGTKECLISKHTFYSVPVELRDSIKQQ